MKASIVIPTFNRLTCLQRVLAATETLRCPAGIDYEVVVVDDGSADGTRDWLSAHPSPSRRVITQANAGPAKARNRGVEHARGEIVLFLGDDTVPHRDWLLEHLESHRLAGVRERLAVLGYTTFPRHQDSPFSRHINELGAQFGYLLISDAADVPFNFFYTSNISLPRSLFQSLGGFREDFPAAAWEDIEFAYRACERGMRILYQPRARTEHDHRIRPGTFCRRQRTAGRSGAIFARLHPELEHFLGVHRPAAHRRGGWPLRQLLALLIAVGERIPGLIPAAVYKRYLDMAYLEGLAGALH